jgi:hypothetical protein
MAIHPVEPELFKESAQGGKITEQLTRLDLFRVEGNPSWEGLLVGFPGNRDELSIKSVGTPYLRMILYPILDLHRRLQHHFGKRLPCVYLVGDRFSDDFLRKFELSKQVVPHIIVLTNDLYQCSKNKSLPPRTEKIESETWTQMALCQRMNSQEGLIIPTKNENIKARFLSSEVPCYEGTENPERLDILGYADSDHSLIAFELKGASVGRVDFENQFLQGIEHRNWLEKNRMAVKLLFDKGPKGRRINTTKRVRLLLGFYGERIPHIFKELRKEAIRRDKYLKIDFVQLCNQDGQVMVGMFPEGDRP